VGAGPSFEAEFTQAIPFATAMSTARVITAVSPSSWAWVYPVRSSKVK
jgi:hypothetical protein